MLYPKQVLSYLLLTNTIIIIKICVSLKPDQCIYQEHNLNYYIIYKNDKSNDLQFYMSVYNISCHFDLACKRHTGEGQQTIQ